jgi:hypothetical protein
VIIRIWEPYLVGLCPALLAVYNDFMRILLFIILLTAHSLASSEKGGKRSYQEYRPEAAKEFRKKLKIVPKNCQHANKKKCNLNNKGPKNEMATPPGLEPGSET